MNVSDKQLKYVDKLKRTADKQLAEIADLKMERIEDKRRIAELGHVISKFGEWYSDNGCPFTEQEICLGGEKEAHEKQQLQESEEDRSCFDVEYDCNEDCQGRCWAKYYAKEWRDRQDNEN